MLFWLRNESTYIPSTYQAALDFVKGVDSYSKFGNRGSDSNDGETFLSRPILPLMRNSYFERLWIVQELLLVKNVRILVEVNVWISWNSLRKKHGEIEDEIRKIIPSTSWLVGAQHSRFMFAGHTPRNLSYYITLTVGKYCEKKCEDPRDKVYGFMALVAPESKVTIDYRKSVHGVYLDAFMGMIREYWDTIHDTPDRGYHLFRCRWKLEVGKVASWDLAQAMCSTDLDKFGLKSFVDGVWERVRQYEITARSAGQIMDVETHCIESVGFEPGTYRLFDYSGSEDGPSATVSDRWWYAFEGRTYYHDCKEWSGDWKHQEYTESHAGLRMYGY